MIKDHDHYHKLDKYNNDKFKIEREPLFHKLDKVIILMFLQKYYYQEYKMGISFSDFLKNMFSFILIFLVIVFNSF